MARLQKAAFILLMLFAMLITPSIVTSWESDGTTVCDTTGDQAYMEMIPDGSGGAILVWEDSRDYRDIYAQRFDYLGNKVWTAQGIVVCGASGSQYGPQIISDMSGGAIIAWRDGRVIADRNVYVQRLNANGDPLWTSDGVIVCSAGEEQSEIRIASDGQKGAIIVWKDERSATALPEDIYVQRVDSSGAVLWTANGVAICTEADIQDYPRIASDGYGGAFITWVDYRGSASTNVYAQHIDEDGNISWAADGKAICSNPSTKYDLEIIADGNHGAVIAWCDHRSWYDLYAQRINIAGDALWTVDGLGVCIAPEQQRYPRMTTTEVPGEVIFTWQDNRTVQLEPDIYARKVSAGGDTLWSTNGALICAAGSGQYSPCITTDNAGGAVIAWQDYRDFHYDVYTQRVDGNGTCLWTNDGVALCTAASHQRETRIVTDGSHGAIVAWVDERDDATTDKDIYIDSVNNSGLPKVPTLLENHSIDVTGTSVIIQWTLSDIDDGIRFAIHRADGLSENFCELPSLEILKSGLFYQAEDITCVAGKTYRYRIVFTNGEETKILLHTSSVTIPVSSIILRQNYPNPFNPRTNIQFILPKDHYVTLDIIDPTGKLVANLIDKRLSHGLNETEWDGTDDNGNKVSSGVYFYRLKAGKFTQTRKMLLLK